MKTEVGQPPWRTLLALCAVVLAAHALVLGAARLRLGAQAGNLPPSRVFLTRTVEAAAPEPMPPEVAPVAPPQPKPKPKFRPKRPAAPVVPAPPAIDSIAELPADNLSAPAADVSVASGTASTADTSATPGAPSDSPAAPASSAVATATPTAPPPLPAPPATTKVTAVSLPGSVRLKYAMTGMSKGLTYHAGGELNWTNNGSQYEAFMRVSAFLLGSRSMTSAGQITPGGLAPGRFLDKSRNEYAAHFLADQGKITFSANTPDLPWSEGAQDRVSIFMQLGGILAGNTAAFPAGSEITVYTVGPRDADTWTFIVGPEETLNLAAGDIATVKVSRKPRREFDQTVEIWYAPGLGYLPVRNRITQANGDYVDQSLTDIQRP